jgi:hypothetical protein
MLGNVEVQDATPVMANDEKAIEQVEGDGGDRKEVYGGNGFAVIMKKRKPTLGRCKISGCTAHPAGDGALRYVEAQHEEFAVDARRTPGRIFNDHLKDQITDVFGNSLPADLPSHFAEHDPIQSESGPVPAHDGFR